MKLFIDTANIEHIKEANDLGVICGVTTNPSLIAKEGRDFKTVIDEITTIVDGPISAEVISPNADEMVEEAIELSKINKNIVIQEKNFFIKHLRTKAGRKSPCFDLFFFTR